MSSTIKTIALIAAATVLVATTARAQGGYDEGYRHHRHHRYATAQPDGSGEPFGYRDAPYPQAYGGYYGTGDRSYGGGYGHGYASGFGYAGGWEAAANARLTAQAYREPGVTLELAPDAKQTATGGPSGGVPGFSGH